MKTSHTIALVGALLATPILLSVAGQDAVVRDPETEVQSAKDQLDGILKRLDAGREEEAHPGLGPQTAAADRAFYNAGQYFDHREFLSVIRELNTFLNLSQVPAPKPYLRAQFMLGASYEQVGYPTKALRAYFRYLATFLTATEPNHEELLDVLRHMVPLVAKDDGTSDQMNQLLASVTNLDLPKSIRAEVFFIAAKAASSQGSAAMASRFLDTAMSDDPDQALKAKGLYLRALLALGRKDYESADDLLVESIHADDSVSGEGRDAARLALARIAIKRKKRDTALKFYGMIDDKSPAFKDALFESVYVHLDLHQDSEARAKAMQFVARFPEDPASFQIKSLLAYLDLRAGDLTAATASIEAGDKHLASINKWMGANLRGKTTLDHRTLSEFNSLSAAHVVPIPTVTTGLKDFQRLAEIARHLADARGELRNMTFTIGRAEIDQLRPQWVNRGEQIALLGDEALKVGHRLAAAERHLYKSRFDAVDWQALTASEDRRTRLLTPAAELHRKMHAWPAYAAVFDLTEKVASTDGKLKKARAEIAASRFLLASPEADAPDARSAERSDTKKTRLEELETSAARLQESLARSLEVLRKEKVESLVDESPHRAARKFLSQYAVALHDEAEIIKRARDSGHTNAERLLAEDADLAWKRWEFVMAELFKQIDGLDADIKTGLGAILADIAKYEQEHDRLEQRLTALTTQLEERLGVSLAHIIDQYSNSIDARVSRHQKWRADIEWMTYQTKLKDEGRLNDRVNLEQQVLKDNLQDLEQGVLWSWPK